MHTHHHHHHLPGVLQELYLDQNDIRELPVELALLPALRKMYVASTQEAQAQLQHQQQAQQMLRGGPGCTAAAAVAAGLIQQSVPFT